MGVTSCDDDAEAAMTERVAKHAGSWCAQQAHLLFAQQQLGTADGQPTVFAQFLTAASC